MGGGDLREDGRRPLLHLISRLYRARGRRSEIEVGGFFKYTHIHTHKHTHAHTHTHDQIVRSRGSDRDEQRRDPVLCCVPCAGYFNGWGGERKRRNVPEMFSSFEGVVVCVGFVGEVCVWCVRRGRT